jgi:hypothetical protein
MARCIDASTKAREDFKAELKQLIADHIANTGLTGRYEVSVAMRDYTQKYLAKKRAEHAAKVRHFVMQDQIFDQMRTAEASRANRVGGGNVKHGYRAGALGTIETDPYGVGNKHGNYMTAKEAWRATLYKAGGNDLAALRDTWVGAMKGLVGLEGRHALNNAMRDIWSGKGSSHPLANKLAKSWEKMADEAHTMMRGMGLDIGKIDGYKLQTLDRDKLYKTGLNGRTLVVTEREFIDDVMTAIDRTKPNPLTGQPWNDIELVTALTTYYQTLVSDGANKLTSTRATGGLQVAHGHHRVFAYTDEGWGRIMAKYGPSDLVSAMFGYVDGVASDLAEVQIWGPRPAAQRDAIKLFLEQKQDATGARIFDDYWRIASGQNAMLPDAGTLAKTPSAIRQVTMMVQLGRALFASLAGDPAKVFIRSIWSDTSFLKYAHDFMAGLPNTEARFAFLQDQLAVWESGLAGANALMKRLGDADWSNNALTRQTGRVLNASGLQKITDAARFGVQMMFERKLAQMWGKTFAELETASPDLAVKLREHGVEQAWDNLTVHANARRDIEGSLIGGKTLDYGVLFNASLPDAMKLKQFVIAETRRTVINANVQGDKLLALELSAGTLKGEAARTFGQYMRYGSAAYYATWLPLLRGAGTRPITRAKLAAAMLTVPIIAGTLQGWLNDLAQGRTPEPLITSDDELNLPFLAKGALVQDIIPIWGQWGMKVMGWEDPRKWEEMFKPNQYGPREYVAKTLSRMTASTSLAYETTIGPWLNRFGKGERDAVENALGDTFKQYVKIAGSALGLNLWYSTLAFQRLVLDEVEQMYDERGFGKRQRAIERILRDRGQEQLWMP